MAKLHRDWGWVLAIGVLGLVLRLTYAWEFTRHPLGRLPWVDEIAYWLRGQEILLGAWLPSRPFYQDPLFPYWLAVLMRVVGQDLVRLRLVVAGLGALTPLAIFWAGRIGLGRVEGIVAGLMAALYGPLIFTDGLLEKEGLAALVAALGLILTASGASPARRAVWAGLSGLAWGALVLLRANALVLAPVGAAWWACQNGGAIGLRRRLARSASFLVGLSLALAPAILINFVVSRPRELLFTTWQGGANFYIGNGPEATGTYIPLEFVEANPAREADQFRAEAERRAGRVLTPGEVSRFWFAAGLSQWRAAPAASLRLLVKKLGLLLHDFEISDSHDLEFVRLVAAPELAWGVLSFGWLAPLAALGLARSPRTPFWWFLVLSTVAGLASTAVFFVVGRYRIPWMPGLMLLGAAGLVDWVRLAARRDWRAAALRLALLATPAAVLAWRPMPDPTPNRWDHIEFKLAMAYLTEGQLDACIDALDDARALKPALVERLDNLLKQGKVHDGVLELIRRRASGTGPLTAGATLHRARWYRQIPEARAESRRLLEALLRANPGNARARREWGAWWLGQTKDPQARQVAADQLAQAAGGPSGDASAALLLALLTADPRPLAAHVVRASRADWPRLRLTQAIVAERRAGMVIYRPWFPTPASSAPRQAP
ncbi:MAG TPA: hypothetical protein VFF52_20045 [Isosphaeraceae bacterium]|nr:hypothetical protein [Isosphaeraceae bacterium]